MEFIILFHFSFVSFTFALKSKEDGTHLQVFHCCVVLLQGYYFYVHEQSISFLLEKLLIMKAYGSAGSSRFIFL